MRKRFLAATAFVALAAAAQADPREALESVGYTGVRELLGVPDLIKGPMISIAMIRDGMEPIVNGAGERIGKVGDDVVEIANDFHPVTSVWTGVDAKGKTAAILFTPDLVLFFKDVPDDTPGRFALEVLFMKKDGGTVIFVLK